ncbi:MAG: RluA family pseudouridine synthase [Gammaproteobacteria bacterium]|nr:RluA family pseudouridine synthase [Gammaproteobacteria bacterium]
MTQQPAPFETHIEIDTQGESAVERLATDTGLSKQRIKQTMQKGAVWLSRDGNTRRLRRASKPLKAGDILHLYYNEEVLALIPATAQLIADEDAYSVWYKPYGMLCQGSKWSDHCTINRWVEQHLQPQRPAFIVHRLDRAATGLIIIAHQKNTAAALSELFQKRTLEKRYRAIVHGHFPENPQPRTIEEEIDDKHACSHVTVVKYDASQDRSLLEVSIETGRKHQIRKHLSGIGFPIVGDRLYGQENDKEDLQLTAYYLAFQCPISGTEKQFQLDEELVPRLNSSSADI